VPDVRRSRFAHGSLLHLLRHCGAKVQPTKIAGSSTGPCPRCHEPLNAVVVGKANLNECARCGGIWADADTLRQICADRQEQESVLGLANHHVPDPATAPFEEQIRYLPCPVCKNLMNRVNFAKCSHVVVDVCRQHGTWFDTDELRRIVEFIRAGGLELSRTRELAELEEARRRGSPAQTADGWAGNAALPDLEPGDLDSGIPAAAAVLRSLFG
jgi:Zn-finger nucleic acid-binding protein